MARQSGVVLRVVATAAVASAGIVVGLAGLALLSDLGAEPSPRASEALSASASPSTIPNALPLELQGLPWVAYDGSGWRAGLSGSSVTFVLPTAEVGLAANGHRVLGVERDETSTLVVHDITTGQELMRLTTDYLVDEGAMFDDRIFVTTRTKDGADGGVWQTMLGGELEPLLPANDGTPLDPAVSSRGPLHLSPGGRTLGSTVCSVDGCVTQVIPVDRPKVTVIADAYLAWLSDDVAIVIDSHHAGGKEIRAYSLSTAEQLWKLTTEGDFYHGYFLGDQRTFVESSTEGGGDAYRYEIALIDGLTGERSVVLSLIDPALREWRLQPDLSTDELTVLTSVYTIEDALAGGAEMRVLDLQDGALLIPVVPFPAAQP